MSKLKLVQNLKSSSLKSKTEFKVSICLNSTCFYNCKHCFIWLRKQSLNSISINSWYRILEGIKNSTNSNIKLNVGGDGMAELDPNLIPILKKSNELGFKTVLSSNGYLINKIIASKLVKSGLNIISLSLDFLDQPLHDNNRGIDKSFDRIKNVIKSMNSKIRIMINCVIMKQNLSQLVPLAKWANSNGLIIGFQSIIQPFNTKLDTEWYKKLEYKHLWPGDEKKVYDALDQLILLKKANMNIGNSVSQLEFFKQYFKNPSNKLFDSCKIDEIGLYVHSNGRIHRCSYKGDIGLIQNSEIKTLINSDKHNQVLEQMKNCSKNCMHMVNCNYKSQKVKGSGLN